MSAIPFTRSLGARSGVQLNYIKDDSERFVGGDSGQVFAGVARFSRGRIDKAFSVSRDEMRRLLGAPVSPSVSTLNEAMIHVYEAFQSGAQRAVISRLVPAAASLKWMVVKDEVTAPELDPVWSVSPTVQHRRLDICLLFVILNVSTKVFERKFTPKRRLIRMITVQFQANGCVCVFLT